MTPNYPNKAADVSIVGAGPVGLTASLMLSRFHVHHLVIEHRLEWIGVSGGIAIHSGPGLCFFATLFTEL